MENNKKLFVLDPKIRECMEQVASEMKQQDIEILKIFHLDNNKLGLRLGVAYQTLSKFVELYFSDFTGLSGRSLEVEILA